TLRRKAAKPSKAQPSRETVAPPSGTAPTAFTLTSSRRKVATPEVTLNARFVLAPEAVAVKLNWVYPLFPKAKRWLKTVPPKLTLKLDCELPAEATKKELVYVAPAVVATD